MRIEITKTTSKQVGGWTVYKYRAEIFGTVYENQDIFKRLLGITGESDIGILSDSSQETNIVIGVDSKSFNWGYMPENIVDLQRAIQSRIDDVIEWKRTLEFKKEQTFFVSV